MLLINTYTDEQLAEMQNNQDLKKHQDLDLTKPIDYQISEARQLQSKKGNEMFELTLKLFQDDCENVTILDWVVLNTGKFLPERKLKDFYKSCGLISQYESKKVDAYFLSKNKVKGQCIIKERTYKNDKGEERKGFEIDKYLPATERLDAKETEFNDDIPF